MEEEWRDTEFPGYVVSSLGRIRGISGRIILGSKSKKQRGMVVNVSIHAGDGRTTTRSLHRIVCLAFNGPPPDPTYVDCKFLNGDSTDNRAINLVWAKGSNSHFYNVEAEGATHFCNICTLAKRVDEFSWQNEKKGTRKGICKRCISDREIIRRNKMLADHIDIVQFRANEAETRRKSKYGIDQAGINRMLEGQNNLCCICSKDISISYFVDHCHNSLKIRGLLCQLCNSGIGFLQDDPIVVRSALVYLEASLEREVDAGAA